MREQDYINLSNLTKLRIAQSILRDVDIDGPISKERMGKAGRIVGGWIDELEQLIETEEDEEQSPS